MKHRQLHIQRTVLCLLLAAVLPILPAYGKSPTYAGTDIYKSSVYYQNLTGITLTGDTRYDVLQVAFSQLGYHGGDSAADFAGDNLTGEQNFTEFNHWYFGKSGDQNGYAWCSIFASWCLRQAKVSTGVCPNFAGCTNFVNWLKTNRYFQEAVSGYIPQPGNLIFFCDRWESNCSTHVGFVVGTEDNFVYTIEGNADMSVLQRRYDLNDPYIIGYGTIAHTVKAGTTFDFPLRYTLSGKGEYTVPSSGLTLYTEPSNTSSSAVVFSAGIHFDVAYTSLGWGRVYLAEDSSAIGVERRVLSKYKDYKDELTEIVTSTAVWFDLTEAEYTERQATEYVFRYDLQGGTVDNPIPDTKVPLGSSVVISSAIPTKEGNTFIGWGYTKADTRNLIQNGDVYSGPYDRVIYAVWLPDQIPVTFLDDNGTTVLRSITVDYGSAVVAPYIPPDKTVNGEVYEFAEWSPALSQHITTKSIYRAVYRLKPKAEESSAIESSAIGSEAISSESISSDAITTETVPVTEPHAPNTSAPNTEATETEAPFTVTEPMPTDTSSPSAETQTPESSNTGSDKTGSWSTSTVITILVLTSISVLLLVLGYFSLKQKKE